MSETKTPDKPDEPSDEGEQVDVEDVFAHGASSAIKGIADILAELENLGGCYSDLRYLRSDNGVARRVAKMLIETRSSENARYFPIEVSYNLPLTRLIQKANFDSVDTEEISKYKFPSSKKGKAKLRGVLISFTEQATIEEVQRSIDARTDGAKHADDKELVVFTTSFPEIQLTHPVFALGSVVISEGKSVVLCATSDNSADEAANKTKKRVLVAETVVGKFGPSDTFLLILPDEDKPEKA